LSRHTTSCKLCLKQKKHQSTIAFEKVEKVEKAPHPEFEALSSAYNELDSNLKNPVAIGVEMTMDDAVYAHNKYNTFDKILVLISSGEGKNAIFEKKWEQAGFPGNAQLHEEYPRDPLLSPRGVGQAMDIARLTAKHFNERRNGLEPELFVVNPLRRATMTTYLAFPQHTPGMLREKPWISHPECLEEANGKASDFVSEASTLQGQFVGVDYSLCEEHFDLEQMNSFDQRPIIESKKDLLRRTNYFLNWLQEREERIVVVGSSSAWLHSLCGFTIDCLNEQNRSGTFEDGELRVIGIKYR